MHPDEATAIIGKFLRQTVRDYVNPALRFSRLSTEREHWETARDFLEERIWIPWGDFNFQFLDISLGVFDIDKDWFFRGIEYTRLYKTKKFLVERKTMRRKSQAAAIVVYVNCCSEKLKNKIRVVLKRLGLTPIFAVTPAEPSAKDFDSNFFQNISLEDAQGLQDDKDLIRKRLDRNMMLLAKVDMVLVVWTAGVSELQALAEVAQAYHLHLPTYIMTLDDGPPVEEELLAYCRHPLVSLDEMIEKFKVLVGSGRATLVKALETYGPNLAPPPDEENQEPETTETVDVSALENLLLLGERSGTELEDDLLPEFAEDKLFPDAGKRRRPRKQPSKRKITFDK